MRGKRAVELACGFIGELCEELFASCMVQVLEGCNGLSQLDLQSVMDGFSQAKSALIALITLKTQYWQSIPWKLAGMFHWNSNLGAQCARDCVDQWERQPVADRHHRISFEFLSPNGKWRSQVDALAQGVPMLKLCVPFIIRCMQLGLVPVVERIMEQRHAFVHRRLLIGKKKKRGAATVSLGSGRMLELERRFECQSSFANKLSENVSKVRNPKEALILLDLTLHPRVASLMSIAAKHNSYLFPGLVDIVYRLAAEDQYRSTTVVTEANAQNMKDLAKIQRKAAQATKPVSHASREGCIRDLMRGHLVETCHQQGPGFQFSVRASSLPSSQFQMCISTLEDHLHTGIGQKAPAAPLATRPLWAGAMQADHAFEEAFESGNDELDAIDVPEPDGGIVTPRGDDLADSEHAFAEVHFKVRSITHQQKTKT